MYLLLSIPWADDSTTLNQYVIDQNLSWPHLTGPVELMEPVWSAFGVGLTTYSDDADGDGVVDGFDTCPDTPKDEPLDHHGCGIDTQGGEQERFHCRFKHFWSTCSPWILG